ncbi:MAG: AAA family ATPase [Lachnospiraceae bacterium]|nr:AAA family ATPase [Lachnospiraceae bacterium]
MGIPKIVIEFLKKSETLINRSGRGTVALECNETMNCKDIIRRIEQAIGMPKGTGSIDERMGRVCAFFSTNKGYLLIMDEADKLLSKYTIKKIELIRNIADGSGVGVVLAGEPALEASLRAWDERFANRMGLIYKLTGLNRKEVERYFAGYEVEDAALEELYRRACNRNTGCFRLLDRTLNNVIQILKVSGKNAITHDVLKEASGMMVL